MAIERWRPFGTLMDRDSFRDDNYLHMERVYGKFERSIRLPMPVHADRVSATYRDGVLEVRLPKTEEGRPKEIKIDVS
jgi:HSP20 family protein